jgi:hypothetical protein
MVNQNKKRSFLFKMLGLIGSGILWVLSIPIVRNWLWKRALNFGNKSMKNLKQDPADKTVIDVDGEEVK